MRMKDQDKTKEQLVNELAEMRRRMAELEASEPERKRTGEALRESEERFRDLYENAPNAYFSVGAEGLIRRCNKRAEKLLGYAKKELVGRPVFDLYADTPQGKEKAKQIFQRFVAGEVITDEELQMQKADGTLVWISLTVNMIRNAGGKVAESRSMVLDITERKRTEEALRKLSQAIEQSPSIVMITDVQDSIEYVNPKFTELTGYTTNEVYGQNPRLLKSGMHSSEFYKELWDTILAGGEWRGQLRNRKKNGELYWESASISPVRNADGVITHFIKVAEDITERKRVEETLERVRFSIDRVLDSVLWVGSDGGFIDVNDTACRNLGYSRDELLSMGVPDIDPNFPQEVWPSHWDEMKRRGTMNIESVHQTKEGKMFSVEVAIHNMRFQDKHYNFVLVRDITERKRTEETLRRLETAVKQSIDGIAVTDLDGNIQFVNPAWAQMHGYSVDDLLHKHLSIFHTEEQMQREVIPFNEQVKDTGAHQGEVGHVRKDGTTFLTWMTTTALRDEEGNPIGFVGTARDITERKRTEETLRKTRDELAALLAISNDVVSTLKLKPLLNLVLEQLKKVVDYNGAAILTLAQDTMGFQAYRGPDLQTDLLSLRFSPAQIPVIHEMVTTRQAFCIEDIQDDTLLAQALQVATGLPVEAMFPNGRTWMGAPLIVKDRVIGMLSLLHNQPNYYQRQALNLVQAFANQVAIAIDNARLYQQAQETAAMAERARLARELHDSVTQALYSVNLYADATHLALSSGRTDVAAEDVRQLRSLAREAMSDMRLLVFELRPSILEEAGLVGALQARLETVEARSGFQTAFQVEGERHLPSSVEAELYRVAQEALNNVIKHAQAKQVAVHLQFNEERLCLTIQDDGIGFDLETARQSGGLGLHSMEERVQQIGGNLILETAPGKGTTLRIEVDT